MFHLRHHVDRICICMCVRMREKQKLENVLQKIFLMKNLNLYKRLITRQVFRKLHLFKNSEDVCHDMLEFTPCNSAFATINVLPAWNGREMNDNDIVYQVPTVGRGDAMRNEIHACMHVNLWTRSIIRVCSPLLKVQSEPQYILLYLLYI